MPLSDPNKLELEKLKIHERLLSIEDYIKEGEKQRGYINDTLTKIDIRCKNIELMIHGDPTNIVRYVRDGMNRRLDSLEEKELDVEKNKKEAKDNFLKIAIGAITLSVGSFVIWLIRLIFPHLGK